uniref:Uncharacterized protein n=1 Tax=Taeniopygia guttata TaxID=59729 RepID=A0A674GD02_TAEGU
MEGAVRHWRGFPWRWWSPNPWRSQITPIPFYFKHFSCFFLAFLWFFRALRQHIVNEMLLTFCFFIFFFTSFSPIRKGFLSK